MPLCSVVQESTTQLWNPQIFQRVSSYQPWFCVKQDETRMCKRCARSPVNSNIATSVAVLHYVAEQTIGFVDIRHSNYIRATNKKKQLFVVPWNIQTVSPGWWQINVTYVRLHGGGIHTKETFYSAKEKKISELTQVLCHCKVLISFDNYSLSPTARSRSVGQSSGLR